MTKPKSKPKAATRSTARNDQQVQVSHAIRACIIKDGDAARHQARPHHRDAADAGWRDDRGDHDRHGLAAAFGARLSCRCRPQEARAQSGFRTNRQGPGLSHQGWQGFVCSCRSREAGGLMRCRRSVAMVVPRPKHPLRTRSRICAVSISKGCVHDGRACFRDPPPAHLPRHLLFAIIAYRIQADRFGDLDHETRQVLDRTDAKETGVGNVGASGQLRPEADRTNARHGFGPGVGSTVAAGDGDGRRLCLERPDL